MDPVIAFCRIYIKEIFYLTQTTYPILILGYLLGTTSILNVSIWRSNQYMISITTVWAGTIMAGHLIQVRVMLKKYINSTYFSQGCIQLWILGDLTVSVDGHVKEATYAKKTEKQASGSVNQKVETPILGIIAVGQTTSVDILQVFPIHGK